MEINSRQNARFKTWLELLDARGIKRHGWALVSGEKLTREFVLTRPTQVECVLRPPQPKAETEWADFASFTLAAPLFQELDVVGTRAPILVVRVPAIENIRPGPNPEGLELVIALSDPNNLGALLRSSHAFGVRRVWLTQEAASPYLPRALRAASGSTFKLELKRTGCALRALNLPSEKTFGLDMNGVNIHEFSWPRDLYLVLGEEGKGLPDLFSKTIKIPMQPGNESLNATIAASIALFAHSNVSK